MRKAEVFFKGEVAGVLIQHNEGHFSFKYDDMWTEESNRKSISFTLPISIKEHHSPYLFSFFYNMLPEGANRRMICDKMRIDEKDNFGILLHTARFDTIGAVTITKV
jgi:HipA-like protein